MSNPCIECGCPALCCRDNTLLRVTGAEVDSFFGGRAPNMCSERQIKYAGGMTNVLRNLAIAEREATCAKAGITDSTTFCGQDGRGTYTIVNVGICPHLVSNSCNIYKFRPSACANFEHDGRSCKAVSRNMNPSLHHG